MPPPDMKVVLLGDNAVGKTCLSHRFANGTSASLITDTTIGVAYVSKEVQVGDNKIVLGVWDTAGDERYDAMTKSHYRRAHAAIVCYDSTRPRTLEKVKYWINELRSMEKGCNIYVCALKKDLLGSDNYLVKHLENAENYANGVPAKFYITSSKTGENIAELFQDIATECVSMVKKPNT